MTEDHAIKLQNISKSFRIYHEKQKSVFDYFLGFLNNKNKYEKLEVLKNISINIERGETFGIIGLNGSGKSTLLKLISKIYVPDSGILKVNGKLVPFLELGTGFNGELTAKDNIILYGTILGFSKKEISKKVVEIIKFAELENFLDTKVKNFSTGMVARLGFATAVQVNPDIILIDEVLSVGDLNFQEKSYKVIKDFKNAGKTIVFVSHSFQQIEELCDRVALLYNGKIEAIGNPKEVISRYREVSKK